MPKHTFKIIFLIFTFYLIGCGDNNKEELKTSNETQKEIEFQAERQNLLSQIDSIQMENRGLKKQIKNLELKIDSIVKAHKDEILKQKVTDTEDEQNNKMNSHGKIKKGEKTTKELRKLLTGKTLNQIIKLIGKPDDVDEYSDGGKIVVWKDFAREPITGNITTIFIRFNPDNTFSSFSF